MTFKGQYLELLSSLGIQTPTVAPGIQLQLEYYLKAVIELNQPRREITPEARERELAMFYFKIKQFFYSRDERVADIKSAKVQEAIKIKTGLFPFGVPKLMLCVDGRVLSKLFAGLHGSALRTPAGDNDDFLPSADGAGAFLNPGQFTRILERTLALAEQGTTCEVLDSHIACAAGAAATAEKKGIRSEELEALRVSSPEEHKKLSAQLAAEALLDDVERKREMTVALKQFVAEQWGGAKRVITIQTSFDPHDGYLYMGLDKDECRAAARAAHGFTYELLSKLVQEGKIIYTKDLAHESAFKQLFQKYYFAVDYLKEYRESTSVFWKNIARMVESEAALDNIAPRLHAAFPAFQDESEIIQRAVLILANGYNAYLHNHTAQGVLRPYPYSEHIESVVAVTKSENGPFDRAASFSIDPNNPNLSGVIQFADGLIRSNRRKGKMSPTEEQALAVLYANQLEAYVKNPIPVLAFERLEVIPSPGVVEKLQQVDWSDLVKLDWMNMASNEFYTFLDRAVPEIPGVVARKINDLRKRAIALFTPGQPATKMLLDGRLVPVWTLSGPRRETIALFPFIAKGYWKK